MSTIKPAPLLILSCLLLGSTPLNALASSSEPLASSSNARVEMANAPSGPTSAPYGQVESSGEPADVEDAVPSTLSLEGYLESFLAASPRLKARAMNAAITALEVEASRNRLSVSARATPGFRYGAFLFGGGSPPQGLGVGYASDLAVEARDELGGTTTVGGDLILLTDPSLSASGHEAHLHAQYALPLMRNAFGRLYAMETAARERSHRARRHDVASERLEQCAVGMELFAQAWRLEAQLSTWSELLELKRRIFTETERDFRRRLVSELDYLAAQSDWLSAQQRDASLRGSSGEALARLLAPVAPSWDAEMTLERAMAPGTFSPELPSGEALEEAFRTHPGVQAILSDVEARRLEAELAWERGGMELALVPRAAVSHYTRRFQPPGANAPLTDVSASLNLRLELPLIAPARRYERDVPLTRALGLLEERDALVDALEARAGAARARARSLLERLDLNQKLTEVLSRQLAQARKRFRNGQLEFQDFMQHWTRYEDARFASADLEASLLLASAEAHRALGVPHPACEDDRP